MLFMKLAKKILITITNRSCVLVLLIALANVFCTGATAQADGFRLPSAITSSRNPFPVKPGEAPFFHRDLPMAYSYVATVAMLDEVNLLGPKLELPIKFPIHQSDLTFVLVAPTNLTTITESRHPLFLGRIDTKEWSFSFSDEGRLCFITNKKEVHQRNRMGVPAWNDMLAGQRPVIDTADAYRMTSNWLAQFPVDVVALNKNHRPVIEQEFRWKTRVPEGRKDYLPLFTVRWGKSGNTESLTDCVVDAEIDGRTKQMMDLRLEDDSISQRPPRILKNQEELLKIGDQEFLGYDAKQRGRLIKEYLTGYK